MNRLLTKPLALVMAAALFLLPACAGGSDPSPVPDPAAALTFTETNTRGNSNGNIANLALGVRQGEWIVFSDLSDGGRLKATRDGGRTLLPLMDDLSDTYACLNLIGDRLDYVSTTYGDVNTIYLSEAAALPTWTGHTYCLHTEPDAVWFIDESGDGHVVRVDTQTGERTAYGIYPAYQEGVTNEQSHAAFSLDGGYVYYCAAENGSIRRVRLSDKTEERLVSRTASQMIVEKGVVFFTDPDEDDRLFRLGADGAVRAITDGGVSVFNTDGETVWYVEKTSGDLMRCAAAGGIKTRLCAVSDAQSICLLGDVMLVCRIPDNAPAVMLFVDPITGEKYQPQQ